jgi:pyrroline-5-carboxylate reductase
VTENAISGKKVAFIGAGNMAEALIKGLIDSRVIAADQISASDILENRRQYILKTHGIRCVEDNLQLVADADVIVLAVKPQVLQMVLAEVGPVLGASKLVLSIVAGVAVKTILSGVKEGTRVIRTIPNTPAMVMEGITGIATDGGVSKEDVKIAEAIFSTVGKTVPIEEKLMDAATGLSASGPAYIFVMIEALADGGVRMGIPRQTALTMAAQTILGSAKLYFESGKHPGELKDMVTSPGGTTSAGLHKLEAGGLRAALINAVQAATLRSEELGKS